MITDYNYNHIKLYLKVPCIRECKYPVIVVRHAARSVLEAFANPYPGRSTK